MCRSSLCLHSTCSMSSSNALNEVKLWANAKEREKFENLAGAQQGLGVGMRAELYLILAAMHA